ncbi:MAG: phosphate propanoyltransferase [Bacillota bacterium]
MAALNAGRKVDDHVPVGISVRHVHIKPDDLAVIYGTGAQLTKMRDLRQPGEFAANETVTLIGPRMRSIENVRILGPVRSQTQVEISRTDAILLGLNPPVRRSGDIAGTPGIALAGPKGIITLKEGVILANRHIHLNEADAVRLGVKGDEEVDVEISGDKSLILRKVQVRVGPKFILEMHLDTDDANAAGINCGAKAYIRRR